LTEGVELEAFRRRHGVDPSVEWGTSLEEVARAGLVETAGGRLRLTDRGMLLSNEVFRIFV
jgi:coproporphyrinogen III oxidase-like Fe-S oxidoreductase